MLNNNTNKGKNDESAHVTIEVVIEYESASNHLLDHENFVGESTDVNGESSDERV